MTNADQIDAHRQVTLIELADRVLDKGVVISGDITLAVADIDLIYVGLRALVSSVAGLERGRPAAAAPFEPPADPSGS